MINPSNFNLLLFAIPFIAFNWAPVSAQEQAQNATFIATAVFVEEAPEIDGFLDDEVWQQINPITNFTQVWPNEGSEPTEKTEVRIAYDENYLYFAFRFYDNDAHLIRAKNLERGGRNSRDDHAYIGLDTFLDGQNAYLFEANALGTQDDAVINNERLDYGSFSWDAVFYSETNIHDNGWDLEVAIPFRQLRFPKDDELEFGLMLSRMINRKNERVMWPAIGMEFGGSTEALAAVSRYGRLTGIKNIHRGKNIEIKPYVFGGVQNDRPDLTTEATENDFSGDFGFDVKYGITSNLTLDLTVNTDFAQVESDNVQINLSRFSLFFPEKREFFQERAGLFEHGNSGTTQTFFSRRIGLEEDILAGARLTGQVGRFSVGLMNIETGNKMNQIFGSESSNNTVARFTTNIFPRASIGTIFTNLEEADGYNRALGFDTNIRFWGASRFKAWYTNIWDSNPMYNDDAGHAVLELENDVYGIGFGFTKVGEFYQPALGFVQRTNMRQYSAGAKYAPLVNYSALPFLKRIRWSGNYDYFENLDGNKESTVFSSGLQAEFSQRDNIELRYERQFERLTAPFNIRQNATILPGDYTFSQLSLGVQTDDSRPAFVSADASTGTFYNGNRTDFGFRIGYRQSQHLTLETGVNHSIIDLPIANGEFEATTLSLNVLAALSRKLFAKTLIQYDNFSRDLQANIRVNWIHRPGSDLFFVYNTSYHLSGTNEDLFDPRRNLIMNNQIAIVKVTYLIML